MKVDLVELWGRWELTGRSIRAGAGIGGAQQLLLVRPLHALQCMVSKQIDGEQPAPVRYLGSPADNRQMFLLVDEKAISQLSAIDTPHVGSNFGQWLVR